MKYLVDTDIIIDYLVAQPTAVELMDFLDTEGFCMSLTTVGEMYEGISYGRNPQQAEAQFQGFLETVEVLPLDFPLLQQFGRLRGDLRQRGTIKRTNIGDLDILIAATALRYNLILVTRNRKHFEHIPHLQAHYPTP